ncbi:MAG TPA: recombinase XerD [Gammaproteobacteria bacterium]|nr:recombinase XerD [Gammaproteobacteria bacterium]
MVNNLIDAWLAYKLHNEGRSEATVRKYRGYLERLVRFLDAEGRPGLLEASTDDLEAFAGLHAHKEGLSPRSRIALVAALKGFYRWARKKGLRPDDPAEDVPHPVAGRRLPIPLASRNAQKILREPDLDTFEGVRDCAMLMVLIGCGLRVSGLVGLNESALQLVEIDGKEWMVIKVREKGKKERLIPAPHDVRYILHAYLGHPGLAEIDRTLPDGDRVLFVSVNNRLIPPHEYHGEARRIRARSVHEMIQKYGKRAGIPEDQLHPHAMRHLFGVELAEHGVDPLLRKALLGHERVETTEIYSHLAMRHLAQVMDRANPFNTIETPFTRLVRELERRH